MSDGPGLLAVAIERIDAANGLDPTLITDRSTPDGAAERPKELVHAERMTHWLGVLDPMASDAQLLAARAHHFRRWLSPRTEFPPGRAGYLKWRLEARRRHAAEVDELLAEVGFGEAVRADVTDIISKAGLGTDPRVQAHEDALCLVFFELQAVDVAEQLGDDTERVVRKTAAKMSVAARNIAAEFDLPGPVVDILRPGGAPATLNP